jgi:hypothetical protein
VKSRTTFEKLLLGMVLVISFSVTVLDFTGAIDGLPWIKSRVPVMTLLVVGVITLSVFTDGDRILKIVEDSHRRTQSELVAQLGADSAGVAVIGRISARWRERETEIHNYFDEVVKCRSERALVERLARYQEQFNSGALGVASKVRFPWDVTCMAMDLTGRLVAHPNPEIKGTRPHTPHHARIISERNGECYWENQYITPQLRRLFGTAQGDEFKHDRFTRVYYRFNRHLNIVCILESHLDLLYQLPAGKAV